MRAEELEALCQEAARDLVKREGRPVPAAAVVPLPEATKVTTFPEFPDDDPTRFDLLTRFAEDVMVPANAPAYGFIAEAVAQTDGEPADVVVVAFGGTGQPPRLTAATFTDDGLGEFSDPEELDPAALPFLSPLRHAAEAARPPETGDVLGGGLG
jgi:hypothetical protein